MSLRQLKPVYFVLAGINSFASAYFFNYLFFLLRDEFGFGSKEKEQVVEEVGGGERVDPGEIGRAHV